MLKYARKQRRRYRPNRVHACRRAASRGRFLSHDEYARRLLSRYDVAAHFRSAYRPPYTLRYRQRRIHAQPPLRIYDDLRALPVFAALPPLPRF